MDPIVEEKLEAITRYNRAASLKKTARLLLSFSIFSLISCTYLFLSASLLLVLGNASREALFLLCNVIVIFLLMDSGLAGCTAPSPCNGFDEALRQGQGCKRIVPVSLRDGEAEKTEEGEKGGDGSASIDGLEKRGDDDAIIEKAVSQDLALLELRGDGDARIEQEDEAGDEEEEEEHIRYMSDDELNKKFDEFIRKVRTDLMFEDRQLVVV